MWPAAEVSSSSGARAAVLSASLIFAVALGLRAWAAAGDFWLDEIWSWIAVRDHVHSVADVFYAIHHDNNHLLNSLWIHALGLDVDWRWYRLPAVLAGSAAVLVARQLLADRPVAQWLLTLLCVPSLLLVNYASEARGYGVMMLCALASLWLLEAQERARVAARVGPWWFALMGFWLATMLGALAHASFGATLVALALWWAWRLARQAGDRQACVGRFMLLFGPPVALATWLWVVDFLHVTLGGGPLMSAWQAAAAACSLALGGPGDGPWVWPLAVSALLGLGLEIVLLWRAGDPRAVLWLLMLVVPALPLAAGVHNQYIYPRFFLGSVLFLLVALASLGARAWRRGGAVRLMVLGVLALVTVGNFIGLAGLMRDGRGHPGAAMRWIADHSRSPVILIATDHAFRHGMTLDFYRRLLHAGQRIQLLIDPPWPASGPEWILRQDAARDWQPAPALHDAEGRAYQLEALYPHAGLSGFTLALYHRHEERRQEERPAAATP